MLSLILRIKAINFRVDFSLEINKIRIQYYFIDLNGIGNSLFQIGAQKRSKIDVEDEKNKLY
jgi:hypothetical protein